VGRFKLVVREGQDKGRVFRLRGPEIILGRPGAEGESTVEFEEPSVSRVHAVLKWREDQDCYELSNRSFTIPARINGEPTTAGSLLLHGYRLQLGALVAEVRDTRQEAPETEPFMGCLELLHGPGCPGTRFNIYRKHIQIGRGGLCDIQLPGPELAYIHAEIKWYEKLPELLPIKNQAIFVNGQAIPRGTFLKANDFILLGQGVALRWLPVSVLAKEERQGTAGPSPPPSPAEEPPEVSTTGAMDMPAPQPEQHRVKASDRAAFFADLAERLGRAQPIREAVEEAASGALPALAAGLSDAILSGLGLAESLARQRGRFSSYELGMVAAGEEAGILEGQLQTLADSLEDEQRYDGCVRRGLGWLAPAVTLGLPGILLFPSLGHDPMVYAGGVAGTLTATALEGLALWTAYRRARRSASFLRWQDAMVDRWPWLGPALRLRAGARFLQALGPLLGSGLPTHKAALLAAGCTGSTAHTPALMEAARRMEQGDPILDALAPTNLLGPEVLAEVEKGEEQGDLPERLAEAARKLKTASQAARARALPALLAGPALLLAMLTLMNLAVVLAWLGH